MKAVELGPLTNGLRVVKSGLEPSDLVIIDGLQRAQAGHKVKTVRGQVVAQPTPPASVDTGPPASTATAADGAR
jgi:hypothetical protein